MRAFGNFLVGIIGSRVAISVFALLFIAFCVHAVSAPGRLPRIAVPTNLAQLGLAPLTPPAPPEIALPENVREQVTPELLQAARELAEDAGAAAAPEVQARAWDLRFNLEAAMAADPVLGRWVNGSAAAAAFVWMFVAIFLYAQGKAAGRIGGGEQMSFPTRRP